MNDCLQYAPVNSTPEGLQPDRTRDLPSAMSDATLPESPVTTTPLTPRFAPARTIVALMLREMGATYGRNPGGYLWAFIEPLGMILVMALAFSFFVRTPPIGTSFILFFATGFLPFGLYLTMAGATQSALRYSRQLLAYPRVTWMDAVLARFLLNALTELAVIVTVWVGILLLVDTHATIDVLPLINSLVLAMLGGLGIGLINALLGGIFPIWLIFWGIMNRPLLFASGVLILYDGLPPVAQNILWWNPLMHVTSLARAGFYATYDAAFVSLTYCYGVALVLITIGLICMRAWYKVVLEQ